MFLFPAVILALAACNRPPAEAVTASVSPEHSLEAAPEVDKNCDFCADPAFVRTCDVVKGVSTTLYWNLADSGAGKVGLFVVDDAGHDSSFAEQPRQGSIQTGPWLKPGLTFKVKELDGTILHTIVIEGKDC